MQSYAVKRTISASNGHTANDPLREGGSPSILRAGTRSSKPRPQSSSSLTDQQVLKREGTPATAMPANAVTSTNGAINTETVNPRSEKATEIL